MKHTTMNALILGNLEFCYTQNRQTLQEPVEWQRPSYFQESIRLALPKHRDTSKAEHSRGQIALSNLSKAPLGYSRLPICLLQKQREPAKGYRDTAG